MPVAPHGMSAKVEDDEDDVVLQPKKRSSAGLRTVNLPPRRANPNAYDELPENPTPEDIRHAELNVSLAELEGRVTDAQDSWETDSMFEDAFEDITAASKVPIGDPRSCTPEEALRLRNELREFGPAIFCQRTVDCGLYTAQKLLTAFGIKAPAFLIGEPDEAYYSLLSLAITKELSKRIKLAEYNTVEDVVRLLDKSSNVIVITGAGISTSLGIPDFRSKGTGLYAQLEHLGLGDPQEVFDIHTFKQDPSIFYSVAKDIVPANDRYTPTHKFINMLHERGKLLTNYSQNIDNLEVKAGLPKEKLIQCHGSFGTASCIQCGFKIKGDKIFPEIRAGSIPRCPRCTENLREAAGNGGSLKRKRAVGGADKKRRRGRGTDDDDEDEDDDIPEAGVLKPDITFFGEELPDEFSRRLTEHDRDLVDLVVVIGTSLKVSPVSEIVSWLPAHVPQVYVSRQAVSHINFDVDLLGDCDVVVEELCRRLRWPLEHEMALPRGQEISVRTEDGFKSRHVFETTPVAMVEKVEKVKDEQDEES